ncbi:MAG TPA: hypothetical protein VJ600_05985 [Holophagaceae bacterium]|nr:hypothetical protein [Holophagaceae bacterium]
MTPIRTFTTALALLAFALPAQARLDSQGRGQEPQGGARGRQEQARPQPQAPRSPARGPQSQGRPEGPRTMPRTMQGPRGMEGPREMQGPRSTQGRPQGQAPRESPRFQERRGGEGRPAYRGRTLDEPRRGQEPGRDRYPSQLRPRQEARGWQRDRGWARNGGWGPHNSWIEHRSRDWQGEHRTWAQRGGYGGYYIPRDRFYAYYGPRHLFRFRPAMYMGYPRFWYGPYTFLIVDPWPWDWDEAWYDDGDCYIDFVDDGYYLFNRRHPGIGLAITITF